MSKPRKKTVIISSVILVLALAVVFAFGALRPDDKPDQAANREVVRSGEFIVRLAETGYLEPLISVDVKSNVEGEIEEVYVDDGDFVEKGDALLKIDDRFIREEVNQAQANLEAAQATLEQARRRILLTDKQQESVLEQARETLEAAQAAYEAAQAITQQQIAQAETNIATTEDSLEQDNIALRQARIALQQARLTLQRYESDEESAKVSLENTASDLQRNQDLFKKGYVAKKTLEDAQTRHANAVSQHQAAQQAVASQEKTVESQIESVAAHQRGIDSRTKTLNFQRENLESLKLSRAAQEKQAEVELNNARTRLNQVLGTIEAEKEISEFAEDNARAGLVRAQSALQNARDRLTWTLIEAPMSGVITQLVVDEGEIVTSGRSAFAQGPAIMQIADLTRMVVKVKINERDISKVEVGQPAELEVDAYPDEVFQGQVTEIAPSGVPDEGVIKFVVTVEVESESQALRPAMSADVDIIVDQRGSVLQLPIDAVIRQVRMIVKATVPNSELSAFEETQSLQVETLSGRKFKGKVLQVDRSASRENVSILLDGMPQGLRTGPTELTIHLGEDRRVPEIAAMVESERKFFARVEKPKAQEGADQAKDAPKWDENPIDVGLRNETHYEIKSGLKEGDRVFVPSIEELTRTERDGP